MKNLENFIGERLELHLKTTEVAVAGETYTFARFLEPPQRVMVDQIFEFLSALFLFIIMVGMGLTLTVNDFTRIAIKPKALMIGAFLQWVMGPLVGVMVGYLMGYHESNPYIFMGIVLVMVSPGGTISNLMTFYAKGDVALSISLTAFSTVLSIILTPILFAFYSIHVTEVPIPVGLVMMTIFGLVLVPLILGIGINRKWPEKASKVVPYISKVGIGALTLLLCAGIITNLEKITDIERYGFLEYLVIFVLVVISMTLGLIFSRMFKVNNSQTKAIYIEVAMRNCILAWTIAILLQDVVGDFYSSMFFVAAMYSVVMILTGAVVIYFSQRFGWLGGQGEEQPISKNIQKA